MKERDRLIEEHLFLVKIIANRIWRKGPNHIERDDLIQSGMIGLIDAVDRFDKKKGNFKAFAYSRIRGSILDDLRKQNFIGRLAQDEINRIEFIKDFSMIFGKKIAYEDLSKILGIQEKKISKLGILSRHTKTVSIDEIESLENGEKKSLLEESKKNKSAFDIICEKETKIILLNLIDRLSVKEKAVVKMYVYDDLKFKEIGKIMGFTESRAFQLFKSGIERIRFNIFFLNL